MSNVRQEGDRLLLLLPDVPAGHDAQVHWWQLRDGEIVTQGQGDGWLSLVPDRSARVIGLAPTASVRMAFPELPPNGQDRQRLAVARLAALEPLLADPDTVQSAAAMQPGLFGGAIVAIAANERMLGWLDWAERLDVRLDHIVPAAMALPLGEQWVSAAVGNDHIVGRDGAVLPDEEALKNALVNGPIEPMGEAAILRSLARVAADPRPDLRSGRFARRRIIIDPSQWKLVGSLAAAIVLVTVLTALVQLWKLEAATDRLNAQTIETAQRVVGPAATLETAEAAVARHVGNEGGRVSESFAGLLARIRNHPDLALAGLTSNSSVVTASLSAPSPQSASPVIKALQRDGYRVAAVPRQSGDGRALVDLTIREGL